jgi:hypothetical protein
MEEESLDLTCSSDFRMLPFEARRRGCPGDLIFISMIELALAPLLHDFYLKVVGDD